MTEIRQDLVQNAVQFLSDPKVQEAPMTKRISFLESKGLTTEEIQVAMKQAKVGSVSISAPPVPPKTYQESSGLTWTDAFIGTIGLLGAGYGLLYLAQQYLAPYINLPTAQKIEQDTKSIESQLEGSCKSLKLVSTQTKEIIQGMESHAAEVSSTLAEMNLLLEKVKENDQKRADEIQDIKKDVEEIKATLPKLTEKTRENQELMIKEIQSEVKSLKSLLMNRQIQVNGQSNLNATAEKFSGITIGKPCIPAWQLAASQNRTESLGKSQDKEIEHLTETLGENGDIDVPIQSEQHSELFQSTESLGVE